MVLIDSELVNRVLYPGNLSPTCVEMHWDSAVWKRPPSSTIAATSCCGASMSSKPQQLPRLDATLSRHSRDEIWGRNLEGWREIGGRAKVPVGTHPGCIWFPRDRRSRGCARSKPQSWETSGSRDLEKRAVLSSDILHTDHLDVHVFLWASDQASLSVLCSACQKHLPSSWGGLDMMVGPCGSRHSDINPRQP